MNIKMIFKVHTVSRHLEQAHVEKDTFICENSSQKGIPQKGFLSISHHQMQWQ